MKRRATYDLEQVEMRLGHGPIVGVDEAGRGPWAGPVVAAAVILDARRIPNGIADSKELTEAAREDLYGHITEHAVWGVGIADVERIDRDNILNATMWAMQAAVKALGCAAGTVLVDGNRAPDFGCRARAVVQGDARCLSIAAASIVAKVTRDRLMCELGLSLPDYGFERHKGYGTPEHRNALTRLGVTAHHRRSFKPVQLALEIA